MRRIHFVSIGLIGVAIVLLVMAAGDMSTYSSFSEAKENPGVSVKINGQLALDKEMYYNPEEDPNHFSFYMIDRNNVESKVILLSAKPQDFERSEEIVLTGYWAGDAFIATDMLMKCPSKYVDEEIRVRAES